MRLAGRRQPAVRYALERGHWAAAAALPSITTRFPAAEAITYFRRALGAAWSGDVSAARLAIQRLEALHAGLAQAKNAYWADQVEIQRHAAMAWPGWPRRPWRREGSG